MRHIIAVFVLHTSTYHTGDGKLIPATADEVQTAVDACATSLLKSSKIIFEVLLSDGSRKQVPVNMTEVGA